MSVAALFSLADQVAVVVGGGGVLCSAIAAGFADAGAAVAVADCNEQSAAEVAGKLCAAGARAIPVVVDVTRKSDFERLRDTVLREFGRLDILLNGAGVNSGTPFFEIQEAEWHHILDVNLMGAFLACQVLGKVMVESGRGGSVINISSVSAGPPLSRVFTYSISKAGINQLTQFLAREWAPQGVRVNAILPGFFPAEQNRKLLTAERAAKIMAHTPMNRYGEARELVGAAIYLAAGQASSFVTGSILRVDGGFGAMTI